MVAYRRGTTAHAVDNSARLLGYNASSNASSSSKNLGALQVVAFSCLGSINELLGGDILDHRDVGLWNCIPGQIDIKE